MKSTKDKTVVFISNFFNHHQKPFSDEMYNKLGKNYIFIETRQMNIVRKKLGWGVEEYPEYVVTENMLRNNLTEYVKIINSADVVIIGSAPEGLIDERKRQKKLIFRYSERPLKKGLELWKYPVRFYTWHKKNPNKNIYMLCASAYTSGDYAKFVLFKNRCYKWGYFTELKKYDDIEDVIQNKKAASILWVARFLELKHPEIPVEIVKRLKEEGYNIELNMIGNGVLQDKIQSQIIEYGLESCVHLLGAMKPEQVREHMEKSEIFLFTSDRNEGWGAVLNEAMNSACVPVVNKCIGSAPFLIENNKNGFLCDNSEEMYQKVKILLDNPDEMKKMAVDAYKTIKEEWNAENAANKFIKLMEQVIDGNKNADIFETGVCSKARVLKGDWYKKNE